MTDEAFSNSAPPPHISAINWPRWSLAAISALIGHTLILVRAANVSAPLYGGDEIAYWHNARALSAGIKAVAFNEYLQQVNCDLFYLMVGWLAQRADGALAMRLLNYMLVVASALIVYGAARTITSRSWSAVAASVVFITGPSIWLIATMPETTYAFVFSLLTFVVVRFWSPGDAVRSVLVGALAGALILIKPHAIAIALACIATMLTAPLLIGRNARAVRIGMLDLLMFAVGTVAAVVALSSMARGELILSPSKFIGEYYGNTLTGGPSWSLARFLDILYYTLAHGVVLAMLFSPALMFSAQFVGSFLSGSLARTAPARHMLILVLFIAFSAASVFAMTAVFTEAAGLENEFERYRIHGRYWTFLMPWLALVAFASFAARGGQKRTPWLDRVVGLVGLAATLLFVLIISHHFSLYPWDFPELFGFYRPELQKWKMQLVWLPNAFTISFVLTLLSSAVWIYGLEYRAMAYASALIALLIVGNVSTTQWQLESAAGVSPRVASGIAARRIVGEQSEGALIGNSYWGDSLYYVAYNLPLRSHIMQKLANSVLTEADLPSRTQWVITNGSYDVQFSYRHAIPLPAAMLYLRDLQAR